MMRAGNVDSTKAFLLPVTNGECKKEISVSASSHTNGGLGAREALASVYVTASIADYTPRLSINSQRIFYEKIESGREAYVFHTFLDGRLWNNPITGRPQTAHPFGYPEATPRLVKIEETASGEVANVDLGMPITHKVDTGAWVEPMAQVWITYALPAFPNGALEVSVASALRSIQSGGFLDTNPHQLSVKYNGPRLKTFLYDPPQLHLDEGTKTETATARVKRHDTVPETATSVWSVKFHPSQDNIQLVKFISENNLNVPPNALPFKTTRAGQEWLQPTDAGQVITKRGTDQWKVLTASLTVAVAFGGANIPADVAVAAALLGATFGLADAAEGPDQTIAAGMMTVAEADQMGRAKGYLMVTPTNWKDLLQADVVSENLAQWKPGHWPDYHTRYFRMDRWGANGFIERSVDVSSRKKCEVQEYPGKWARWWNFPEMMVEGGR